MSPVFSLSVAVSLSPTPTTLLFSIVVCVELEPVEYWKKFCGKKSFSLQCNHPVTMHHFFHEIISNEFQYLFLNSLIEEKEWEACCLGDKQSGAHSCSCTDHGPDNSHTYRGSLHSLIDHCPHAFQGILRKHFSTGVNATRTENTSILKHY